MRILDVLNAPHLRFLAEDQMSLFPGMGTPQPVQPVQPASPIQPQQQPVQPKAYRRSFYDPGLYLPGSLGQQPAENALTVNDILHPNTPAYQGSMRQTHVIANELMNRGRRALQNLGVRGGMIEKPSPRTDEIISRAIASEVKTAIERDKSRSSIDWYTQNFREAMTIAAILHPEIAKDPNAKMAFTAALAITSQGEKVIRNVPMAEQIYSQFKQTGKFPTNVKATKGKSINNNFDRLNQLIAEFGISDAREFLARKFTVRELKQRGFDVHGENFDTEVYGSMIFGPKIGQGFYQNLAGNYDPVTMDLWFMRAWGRLTGTLVGKVNEKLLAKQRERFVNALHESGIKVPESRQALAKLAKKIHWDHEKNFHAYRAEFDAGVRTKDEVVFAAERYWKGLHGINETPTSGDHRAWMRSRVNRAREILSQEGINITNADLQAIWWYPEKELYKKLGGRDNESLNIDYATAFKILAQKKGIDNDTIEAALASMDR